MTLPFRTARATLRQRFGGDVFRVVVDAGFSCPNRDGTCGTAGCVFCNIEGFRPPTSRPERPLPEQVARALPVLRRRHPRAVGHLIYFQPFTNTYGSPATLAAAITASRACEGTLGIVIGTRPDCLPPPILDVLSHTAAETYLQVELGVQSTDDETLAAMRRGHDWDTSRRAIAALRSRGIEVGAHVILGTPWEAASSQVQGAARLTAAGITAVKIHHLQVLRGTPLARGWRRQAWAMPSWRDYARLVADFLEHLGPKVIVDRLTARAPHRLLIAPQWGVPAVCVRDEIVRLLRERGSCQGKHEQL